MNGRLNNTDQISRMFKLSLVTNSRIFLCSVDGKGRLERQTWNQRAAFEMRLQSGYTSYEL